MALLGTSSRKRTFRLPCKVICIAEKRGWGTSGQGRLKDAVDEKGFTCLASLLGCTCAPLCPHLVAYHSQWLKLAEEYSRSEQGSLCSMAR